MQQRRLQRRRVQHLDIGQDERSFERVTDIRVAGPAELPLMGALRRLKRRANRFNPLRRKPMRPQPSLKLSKPHPR